MNSDKLIEAIEDALNQLSDVTGDLGVDPMLGFVLPESPKYAAGFIANFLAETGILGNDQMNTVAVDTKFNKDHVSGTVRANFSLIDAMRALFIQPPNDTNNPQIRS